MGSTTFSGPVTSTNGFVGAVTATTAAATTSLTVGGGTAIVKIVKGSIAVDLASVLTLATTEATITLTGAAVGDSVFFSPPTAGLTAGMCVTAAYVSATDTVKLRVFNGSAGTIDEASATFFYTIIRS